MTTAPCTLTDVSSASTQGEVDFATLTLRERAFRAVKRASIFGAIAVVCVLIPMLHFVLVPAFLITGVFVFIKTIKETELVIEVRSECPACRKPVKFHGPISATSSKEICPHCRQLLKIKIAKLFIVNAD